MIPQLLLLALFGIAIGASIAKHGEQRPPYNAVITLLSAAIEGGLLYWGGFFDCFLR